MSWPETRFLVLLVVVAAACSGGPAADQVDDPSKVGKADGTGQVEPLLFEQACRPGTQLTIAAVGDVLLHGGLQKQAYAAEEGFVSLWREVAELLAEADVTYANLEGPTAQGVDIYGRDVDDPGRRYDGEVYTSYPQFNYHPSLLDDLLQSGVDVVSTANNHSLDRRTLGVNRTLDALQEAGLPHTGTRRSPAAADEQWYALTRAGEVTLAWVACTYGTNGIPDRDDQVLWCYDHEERLVDLVRELSQRDGIDAVIVTPHWGEEYQSSPNNDQRRLGRRLLDAGALAVIGSHPHVLQPWERYVTDDGRETFIIYSLGNFVSGQRQLPRRSTILLNLGLTRGDDGRVTINGARYVPLHMSVRDETWMLEPSDGADDLQDSRTLVVGMYGPANKRLPHQPPLTNPQCDPDYVMPHPHDGWIGGRCEAHDQCGGARCLTSAPGGICSERCSRYCPDRSGRATTFCADIGRSEGGICLARCSDGSDCRPGYECVEFSRFSEAAVVRRVCSHPDLWQTALP